MSIEAKGLWQFVFKMNMIALPILLSSGLVFIAWLVNGHYEQEKAISRLETSTELRQSNTTLRVGAIERQLSELGRKIDLIVARLRSSD